MRHLKREVIERTQREYDALDRTVRRLGPSDWRRTPPRSDTDDPWTVKDVLVHITYWKEHSARVFRGEKRPPELRGLDVNAINALIYRRWRGKSPAAVIAYHRATQREVLRLLRERPQAWFSQKEHAPDWPGDFGHHSRRHRMQDIAAVVPVT